MISKQKRRIRFIKSTVTLVVAVGFLFAGVLSLWAATLKMPDLSSFEERKVRQSTKIYDRTGEVLLYDVHQDIRRTIVPMDQVSNFIKEATVAIEDSSFYKHEGVRVSAIFRALFANTLSGNFSQGGSTITQQVIKNSVLTPEKKVSRKIKEWILAIKLEKRLTKDEILELYLNEAPYGGNIYGIEEASRAFFGKSAKDINLVEAAYLAALPQAPTYLSPYGNNVDALENRKNLVLKKMNENDFISEDQYLEALDIEVVFQPRSKFGIRAPHFVFFVREHLALKYGEGMVEEGGLKIITTIDWELQEKAEEIIKRHALENSVKFNAENAGLVAIDPNTGQILAMVGSRDYFDEEIPGAYNIATAHRQPGSAFKPIVYATALEKGYTPETVVFDLKTQFSTACAPSNFSNESPCYSPSNYDDAFRGPITFKNALAQSVNVPAVKALYLTGLDASLKTAKEMGIESLADKERYGLTLVLGGGEVSLLDMTSAYGVFANEGKRMPYNPIIKIEDSNEKILEEFDRFSFTPKQVISRNTALMISDMLADNDARAPAFGNSSYLYFPGIDVAVKTGTTNDYKDAWIIGYNPEIVVGTWAGNNDNTSMEKRVAGFIVAPMWNEFMVEALKKVPRTTFAKAEREFVSKPVLRGVWQGGNVFYSNQHDRDIEFADRSGLENIVTSIHSILYWVDKNDPRGPYPSNPSQDPQFSLWEYPVRLWAAQRGYSDNTVLYPNIENSNGIINSSNIEIIGVSRIINRNTSLNVSLEVNSDFKARRVEYFINGSLIGSSSKDPFALNIDLSTSNLTGLNTLRAVVYDNSSKSSFSEVEFYIE